METVTRHRLQDNYAQLARTDARRDCSGFIEFILQAIAREMSVERPEQTRVERSERTPSLVLVLLRRQPELPWPW